MKLLSLLAAPMCLALAAACGDAVTRPPPADDEEETFPAASDANRDILKMALDVSLTTLEATATITLAGSDSKAASFEAQGLEILDVRGPDGALQWALVGPSLDVGVPPSSDPIELAIDYRFAVHGAFDGWLGESTLIWPYHCGNLFPCRSTPSDGLAVSLDIHDDPAGRVIVQPPAVSAEMPSYVTAWAVGDYAELDLGTTAAGTGVRLWYLPGQEQDAVLGGEHLVAAFEYYESALGPYVYGSDVGGVGVVWGDGAVGGMEHHPYWHVDSESMRFPDVHVHEAAHGWFGDGVRIACWEDFVLSEGTVSYLTARAYQAVATQVEVDALWAVYQSRLDIAMASAANKIAWPDSCGVVDVLEDGLLSSIPYMKGAFFYRALEATVGADPLMSALARFYSERVGTAAGMQDLLDTIADDTGYDPTACADAWLRQEAVPSSTTCP